MNTFSELLQTLLGISTEAKELTFLQVSVRGVIVFIATLVMVRLSSKRSLAEKTAFDAVLVVIIGSMLSRAINGSAAFLPTLGSGFVLVLLHRLFGFTVALVKRERDSVHAIAKSTRLRAVIEDMSKMRATARARNFSAENR